MLTASRAIEVNRTVDRDRYLVPGEVKELLDPPLEGQRVTLRFESSMMHVLAQGRLVKTLPAPLEPNRR